MRRHILLATLAAWLPATAFAENLAVVLANQRYDSLPGLRAAAGAGQALAALEAAGFEVIEIRDERFGAAASALSAERGRIAQADRLIILVAGHFASSAGQGWLLTRDARQPDDLTLGAQALPLATLLGMAAAHPGAAAVLVADDGARITLGPGLALGPGEIVAPQGVTVLSGTMRGILAGLEDGLLVEGQSLAETADTLPGSVTMSGFISDVVPFLPGGEDVVVVRPTPLPALPAPDPVATAEAIEAGLALDRDTRRSIQRDLSILGYDPRGIDGIFGRGTRTAISTWQRANRFDGTGFLTGNQVALLQTQGAERSRQLEAEAAARQAEEDRKDTSFWRETGAGASEEGVQRYLERYPDGLFAGLARTRLEEFEEARRASVARAEREFWDNVKSADTVAAYQRYLETYPRGAFRADAEKRLAELRAAETETPTVAEARAEENRVAGSTITRLLVEQRLRQLGLEPGRIDGTFDEDSRRAIRRYQRARDLPVTGYVSQATLVRLLASGG